MGGSGEGSNAARQATDWVKLPPTKQFSWLGCFVFPVKERSLGNFSLCLFLNYAYMCTWIRQNLNETVLQLDFHDLHWENKTYKLQRSIRQRTEPFSCATVDTVHNINRRSSRNNQTYNFQFFLLDQEGEVSCNIIMYALKRQYLTCWVVTKSSWVYRTDFHICTL